MNQSPYPLRVRRKTRLGHFTPFIHENIKKTTWSTGLNTFLKTTPLPVHDSVIDLSTSFDPTNLLNALDKQEHQPRSGSPSRTRDTPVEYAAPEAPDGTFTEFRDQLLPDGKLTCPRPNYPTECMSTTYPRSS